MKLVIANKCYSSWSMRPWILMKALGVPFDEALIPFHAGDFRAAVHAIAPGSSGRVPCLVNGDGPVWESLAIMEYLADTMPAIGVWPADPRARAHARVISHEMHAGFRDLRAACPMNFGKRHAARDRGEAVARDVARIAAIWRDARERFGVPAGGPFLFGAFTAADAMYAPVVSRFDTYSIPVDPVSEEYMRAVIAHPAYQEWRRSALAEPWVVADDEADEPAIEDFRKPAGV